jgi:hypothetical protein
MRIRRANCPTNCQQGNEKYSALLGILDLGDERLHHPTGILPHIC